MDFDTELLMEEEATALKQVPPLTDEEMETAEDVEIEEVSPLEEEPKKNLLPYSVLEEEKAKTRAVEAELEELRKPKDPEIDFQALGKKFYESEEGAAEVLQSMHEQGIKVGQKVAAETAASVIKSTAIESKFQDKVKELKGANPWITPGLIENTLVNRAFELINERKVTRYDLDGVVKAAEDAIAEGKKVFRIDEPKVDVKATIKSKFDEIDKLSGIEFEEAYGQLTPEEREAFLGRTA